MARRTGNPTRLDRLTNVPNWAEYCEIVQQLPGEWGPVEFGELILGYNKSSIDKWRSGKALPAGKGLGQLLILLRRQPELIAFLLDEAKFASPSVPLAAWHPAGSGPWFSLQQLLGHLADAPQDGSFEKRAEELQLETNWLQTATRTGLLESVDVASPSPAGSSSTTTRTVTRVTGSAKRHFELDTWRHANTQNAPSDQPIKLNKRTLKAAQADYEASLLRRSPNPHDRKIRL